MIFKCYIKTVLIFLSAFTISCSCAPETYGPLCALKFDDCQGGSETLCGHGICIDADRDQPDEVRNHV